MKTPNIIQYYNMLDKFDWGYEYSDDYNVWKSRANEFMFLYEYRTLSDLHCRLYEAFQKFHFKGLAKPDLNDYLITLGGLGIDYYEDEDC